MDKSDESEHKLKQFIEICQNSQFRRRDELIEGLRNGEINLISNRSENTYPTEHFLDVYRRRCRHLQNYTTQHSRQLLADVEEFISQLISFPDETVNGWIFVREPNILYTIFEGTVYGKILGCIRAVDKRLTSPEEWQKLWGIKVHKNDQLS